MKIKWRFVRHGELSDLDDNEVAVDVSSRNTSQALLFDHHSSASSEHKCSASVVMARKNELEKLKNKKEVIIHCHSNPDVDCAVSSFLVVCYLKDLSIVSKRKEDGKILKLEPFINQLLHVVNEIDQGKICPLSLESNKQDFNFYSFFLLLDDFIKAQKMKENWGLIEDYISQYDLDLSWDSWEEQFMAYSFALLMQMAASEDPVGLLNIVNDPHKNLQMIGSLDQFPDSRSIDPKLKPVFLEISGFIKQILANGRTDVANMFRNGKYDVFRIKTTSRSEQDKIIEAQVLYAKLPFSGLPVIKTLRGLYFDYVQNQKLDILAFEPVETERQVIISVDPRSDISLKGLGLALDRESTKKSGGRRIEDSREWRIVDGKEQPDPLFLYQDPWYDGRGFEYTIVDAPSSPANRYLSVEEIKEVIKSEWYRLAQEYATDAYKKWLSGKKVKRKTTRYEFDDTLYTRHFLYPLVSLYPMQIDLHWIIILMNEELSSEAGKHFEELSKKRPQWPLESKKETGEKSIFEELIDYISSYKEKCQSKVKSHDCIFEDECENSKTNKNGWCKRYHYTPVKEKGQNLPRQLEALPSAYEIMNHQLEWLKGLHQDTGENLNYLQNVIKDSLLRLLKVRDRGEKHETREISVQDLSLKSILIDHRINRFCDYILEEIEEICLGIYEPFPKIQERVDNAQRYIKNGMDLLENLDIDRQKLFVPFLANIVAFLESMDRMLHRFELDDPEIPEVPREALFLLKLPLEKQEKQTRYQVFREFIQKKIKGEKIRNNPEVFFQSPYWSYTAVGPRILGELYMATVNHAVRNFDYYKARHYIKELKQFFITPLSVISKIKLLLKGNSPYLKALTGLKINYSKLAGYYLRQLISPFWLKVTFGIGLLVTAEMDYGIWNKHIKAVDYPWLVIALLIFSGFAGTYSIIPGKKRFKRAMRLFGELIGTALIPSLLSCLIFYEKFRLKSLSFLFLVFGGIFFAVVINTFISGRKR